MCSLYALFLCAVFCVLFMRVLLMCSSYALFLCAFVCALFMLCFYTLFLCAFFMPSFIVLFVFALYMRSFYVLFVFTLFMCSFYALFSCVILMCSFHKCLAILRIHKKYYYTKNNVADNKTDDVLKKLGPSDHRARFVEEKISTDIVCYSSI